MIKSYKKQKKNQNFKLISIVCILAIITIGAGIGTTKLTRKITHESVPVSATEKNVHQTPVESEISLLMVGDNLLHMPLIADGKQEDGTYNFDGFYEELKDEFIKADISAIVQETVLGGEKLGYSGYPMFNSPQEVGDALVRAGFDIILSATNHALDKGENGILNTLEFWKKYPQIKVLGIHSSQEAYDTVNYIEKNGIKLAVLNYTDSTNGISSPKSKEYLINRVNKEKIVLDLYTAEQNADFTVVFMHWGTEYKLSADQSQKDLARYMAENGADLIMGSHPHVIEPVEWIQAENGNKALVFYSLGNYISRQKEAANLLGAIGKVTICSNDEKGTFIKTSSVTPIVTHYNKNSRGFRVYRLADYTDDLASKHGVSLYDGKVTVERFQNIFNKVFDASSPVTIIQ